MFIPWNCFHWHELESSPAGTWHLQSSIFVAFSCILVWFSAASEVRNWAVDFDWFSFWSSGFSLNFQKDNSPFFCFDSPLRVLVGCLLLHGLLLFRFFVDSLIRFLQWPAQCLRTSLRSCMHNDWIFVHTAVVARFVLNDFKRNALQLLYTIYLYTLFDWTRFLWFRQAPRSWNSNTNNRKQILRSPFRAYGIRSSLALRIEGEGESIKVFGSQ